MLFSLHHPLLVCVFCIPNLGAGYCYQIASSLGRKNAITRERRGEESKAMEARGGSVLKGSLVRQIHLGGGGFPAARRPARPGVHQGRAGDDELLPDGRQ